MQRKQTDTYQNDNSKSKSRLRTVMIQETFDENESEGALEG